MSTHPMRRIVLVCLLWLVAVIAAVGFTLMHSTTQTQSRARPVFDPELSGATVKTEVDPDAEHCYRQTVFHADGVTPRLVKHCYDNNHPHHLLPHGNVLLYEYFRQDGTLEKTRYVEPFPSLGASVMTKYHWTYFGADGKTELRQEYFRADDTLGAVSDRVTNTFTEYRLDGVTLRSLQTYDGKDHRLVYYRKDGKTPWWLFDYGSDVCQVNCDLDGNTVDKKFKRKALTNGFSMGSGDPPVPHYEDSYLRPDGSVEYRQTWVHMWNAADDEFYDALTGVEVFAADGKTLVAEYALEPRCHRGPLFIKSARVYNGDGSSTLRKYAEPDVLTSEQVLDASSNVVKSTPVHNARKHVEQVQPIWLHGFGGLNLYGYDNDFNDR